MNARPQAKNTPGPPHVVRTPSGTITYAKGIVIIVPNPPSPEDVAPEPEHPIINNRKPSQRGARTTPTGRSTNEHGR